MKTILFSLFGLLFLFTPSTIIAEETAKVQPSDTTNTATVESNQTQESDQIVIYYLHMNRRCMTCEKLEAFSSEAVSSGFAEQLKDSSIVLRIINFEEEGNEHFAKTYKLYSQSLIASKVRDGKEIKWKNLDKIWELVNAKDDFITYVQSEVKNFINPTEEK